MVLCENFLHPKQNIKYNTVFAVYYFWGHCVVSGVFTSTGYTVPSIVLYAGFHLKDSVLYVETKRRVVTMEF